MTESELFVALTRVSPSPTRFVRVQDNLLPPVVRELFKSEDKVEYYVMVGGAWPEVRFRYTNHRGQTRVRRVSVHGHRWSVYLGISPLHPEVQWLFDAYDLDKQAARTFAVKDMADLTFEHLAGAVPSDPPRT